MSTKFFLACCLAISLVACHATSDDTGAEPPESGSRPEPDVAHDLTAHVAVGGVT